MKILTQKYKSDSIGKETLTATHDWIDVSFYTDKEEKYLTGTKRHFFNKETTLYTVCLDNLPYKAVIDPKRMMIDKVFSDNSKSLIEL